MTANIDWKNLTFGVVPTKTMYVSKAKSKGEWAEGEYLPYGEISIHPAAGVLNYGQGIFEGLKAQRTKKNEIVLFRPDQNAQRFADGAKRLCMPPFPQDKFVEVMKKITLENHEYIPPYGKGSLYIRPLMSGTGAILGLAPAPEYTMIVFTSPVGAYFQKKSQTPTKIEVCTEYHRSAAKGMGNNKYIGNYAGEIYFSQRAKSLGYNGCLYLDARNERMIEEVGAANFFCVIDNKLLTPNLGSILPGVTRDSIIYIARNILGLTVEEREVSIDEALQAQECFCTGTAAVIAPIGTLLFKDKEHVFNHNKVGPITKKLYDVLTKIQLCEMDAPDGWIVNVQRVAEGIK